MLLVLAAIFSLRITEVLKAPQFWAEDGGLFFKEAWFLGTSSLFIPVSGYHHLVPRLVALLASTFDLAYQPVIYCYFSILATLSILLLVISKRLEMPNKPLLALAVVAVPHNGESFANLANLQWMLAIGLFVVIMFKPGISRRSLIFDAGFLLLTGLTGPFITFMVPVLLVKYWMKRKDDIEQKRLQVLIPIAITTALVQFATYMLTRQQLWFQHKPLLEIVDQTWNHFSTVYGLLMMKLFGYSMHTILSIITRKEVEQIGIESVVRFSVICSIIFLVFVAYSMWQIRSLRFEKLAMLYFALALLLMVIVRFPWVPSATVTWSYWFGNDRYFIVPRIMVLWISIVMLGRNAVGLVASCFLVVILATAAMNFRGHPWVDYNWKFWAKVIALRVPVKIPINPPGFVIDMTTNK